MFFLLPAREITNSTVNDFKSSLSQYNELNYYTVPLCNYKNPGRETSKEISSSQEIGNEILGLKSTNIKKSNPAIKSKPVTQPLMIDGEASLKCELCGWNYPKSLVQQDKDSHYERCKKGYGEPDKKLWAKCKSDRALFRKKIEALEETRNKEIEDEKEQEREEEVRREKERKREHERELEIERKREEEKEKPKRSHKKKKEKIQEPTSQPTPTSHPIPMEIESDDSDFDIPIPKKSQQSRIHQTNSGNSQSQNHKRLNPITQSQFVEVYDLEREDIKKVKKSTIPSISNQPTTNFNQVRKMIGRKSASSNAFYTIE